MRTIKNGTVVVINNRVWGIVTGQEDDVLSVMLEGGQIERYSVLAFDIRCETDLESLLRGWKFR